ncbi:hypothetical protein B0H17DRAFT_1071940 [Mycena rosella]|uniref:F-box domain-containing protein n=1 Tax=Mycena rosella TaxID=1033263 RepID=A0AAD7DA12_MYCRO|nr:hypothetical protein B0H17DRAFT_1071940 [Mycena rosella]
MPPEVTPDVQLTEQLAQLSLRLSNARDTLAAHMDSIAYGRQVPVEAPLLLCQICSAWRRVALVTPGLWCSLAWKALLDSWLGRSGKSPISLSIAGSRNTAYQYFNDHIAKLFLQHSDRWRCLRLDDVPPTSRVRLLNTYMPLLETLEISGGGMSIFSADAPRLRKFCVLDADTDPASIHLPWERLASFRASAHIFKLDKCFTLLAKCRNLTRCTVQLSAASWNQTLVPLRMARLRTLTLVGAFGESDAGAAFFANIELPALDTLVLIDNVRPGSEFALGPHSAFGALARKSNLRSLRLVGGKALDSGLFDAVVAIPSLREVVVTISGSNVSKRLPRPVQEALDMRK